MYGAITVLFLNPEQSAHTEDNITERTLLPVQPSRYLDLDGGEHGHPGAHHVRRDLYLGPPAKVRPSLGGCMQRTRFLQDDKVGGAPYGTARPAHPGIDAKKALVGGKVCQDFPYTFGFFHTNIIT